MTACVSYTALLPPSNNAAGRYSDVFREENTQWPRASLDPRSEWLTRMDTGIQLYSGSWTPSIWISADPGVDWSNLGSFDGGVLLGNTTLHVYRWNHEKQSNEVSREHSQSGLAGFGGAHVAAVPFVPLSDR